MTGRSICAFRLPAAGQSRSRLRAKDCWHTAIVENRFGVWNAISPLAGDFPHRRFGRFGQYRKARATPRSGAHLDPVVEQLGRAKDNEEAEAKPADAGPVAAMERLEDLPQSVSMDTRAAVAHHKPQAVAVAAACHLTRPLCGV